MSTEITKLQLLTQLKKKVQLNSLMERDNKTYAQVIQTKECEYFGREIQVAAKRKELHTKCSHYSGGKKIRDTNKGKNKGGGCDQKT